MSTIQVIAKAAGQAGRVMRGEYKQPGTTPSDTSGAHDQDMMYAWSIGVTTEAVQEGEPSSHEHEECPPEVYIG